MGLERTVQVYVAIVPKSYGAVLSKEYVICPSLTEGSWEHVIADRGREAEMCLLRADF